MSTYTAVTIGPIYKTFSQARKSRELWAASYLFSFITREILERIMKKEILPCIPFYPNKSSIDKKGAGFFPDRLIYEGDVKQAVNEAEMGILGQLAEKSKLPLDYLNNYLRISTLTFSLPVDIRIKADEDENIMSNIVFVANRLLDTIELKEKYYKDITNIKWRKALDYLNGQVFYLKAFSKENGFEFPSLLEIATDDFRKKNPEKYGILVEEELNKKADNEANQDKQDKENQLAFIKHLTQNDDFKPLNFRSYHKYVAVIEADGDNVGATIGKIGKDVEKVKQFSKALFNFAKSAVEKITNYGGKPVYAGGDDLLFFAPIAVCRENENSPLYLSSIFDLVTEIDKVFEENIIKNPKLMDLYEQESVPKPTMSYGISITYYKFPLNEAREFAHALLENAKDKNVKDDEPKTKNKICFKLRKHSGQSLSSKIDKNKLQSFECFRKLTSNISPDKEMITSVIYRLKSMNILLRQMDTDKTRLNIFFGQEFEVDLEKELSAMNSKERFIKEIVDYYHQLTVDFPYDNIDLPTTETDEDHSNIGKLHNALRFIKHLTDDSDE
jgi:CRISPR-associated protein Cmr2